MWLIPLAALWGGVWWRLRGGALTAMTGFDPGTGGMRAIAAGGLCIPLAGLSWHLLALIPAFWVGWSISGWGAFQGMGRETSDNPNPVSSLLDRLIKSSLLVHDFLGMAMEGVIVTLSAALVLGILSYPPSTVTAVAFLGLFLAPSYLVGQWSPWRPNLGKFAVAGSEWGEVLSGASVYAALVYLLTN